MDIDLSLLLDIASGISFAIGAFFLLVGSFGMIRMPDFFSRLHAAGVVDTLGLEMLLFGMLLQAGFTIVAVKLLLIGLFIFLTSPTGTHAVAHAAYVAGMRPQGKKPAKKAGKAKRTKGA